MAIYDVRIDYIQLPGILVQKQFLKFKTESVNEVSSVIEKLDPDQIQSVSLHTYVDGDRIASHLVYGSAADRRFDDCHFYIKSTVTKVDDGTVLLEHALRHKFGLLTFHLEALRKVSSGLKKAADVIDRFVAGV